MTKDIKQPHGGELTRRGRPKGKKNKATIFKEKILEKIEKDIVRDVPRFYRQLAETATAEDAPPWAVRLYGELILKPVMKTASDDDKDSGSGGIRIIVQGTTPKVESDEPIDAEYEEIENETE